MCLRLRSARSPDWKERVDDIIAGWRGTSTKRVNEISTLIYPLAQLACFARTRIKEELRHSLSGVVTVY
jgi:hypothetical protein